MKFQNWRTHEKLFILSKIVTVLPEYEYGLSRFFHSLAGSESVRVGGAGWGWWISDWGSWGGLGLFVRRSVLCFFRFGCLSFRPLRRVRRWSWLSFGSISLRSVRLCTGFCGFWFFGFASFRRFTKRGVLSEKMKGIITWHLVCF